MHAASTSAHGHISPIRSIFHSLSSNTYPTSTLSPDYTIYRKQYIENILQKHDRTNFSSFFRNILNARATGRFFVCVQRFFPHSLKFPHEYYEVFTWKFVLFWLNWLEEIERIPNSIFIFPTFCQMSRSATSKHERLVKFLWAIYLLWIGTPPFNHFASWFWVKIYSVQPSIL